MAAEQQLERVDPPSRSVSQAFMGRVANPDSNRVYLLANPHDDTFGAPAAETDGWQYLAKGCKERVTGAREAPDGTGRLMVRGQFVMWRPKKDHEAHLAQKHAAAGPSNVGLGPKEGYETVEVIGGNKKE